ncbi:MAG: Peptidase [Bacteroidetes bacterium]|nr:Peptidase [Bacteroidota bacterium]
MHLKYFILTSIVSLLTINANAQFKVMAAPDNMKSAAKRAFPTIKQNFPTVADTTNIYNEMLNDESDDLMENHPAGDIYNDIWSSERINPYKVPIESMPDSIRINCSDFVMPVSGGRISSQFGPRRYRYHYGIDVAIKPGNEVRSVFSGKVRVIDYEPGGYGNYVVVRHDNGLETVYAHLSFVKAKLNQAVKAGEELGLSGNTGRSTGPHLHFETRYVGNAFNPATLINFEDGRVYAAHYTLTKRKNFYFQQSIRTQTLAKYYKVHKGDNLGRIAARNNTTVTKLKKLNGISRNGKLKPGNKLRIR